MKIINYTFLLLLIIFTNSCGYKAINNLDSYDFIISDYELTGDKKINFILEKNFKRFKSDGNSKLELKIVGISEKNISILSKDTEGNVSTYNIEINIEIKIFKNQKQVDSVSFKESTNYDNLNSKFELKQYENILLKDLVNQIVLKVNNHIDSLK